MLLVLETGINAFLRLRGEHPINAYRLSRGLLLIAMFLDRYGPRSFTAKRVVRMLGIEDGEPDKATRISVGMAASYLVKAGYLEKRARGRHGVVYVPTRKLRRLLDGEVNGNGDREA